ncbi:hypothetical protein GCM10027048_28680 [Hymenobacter coalescens]
MKRIVFSLAALGALAWLPTAAWAQSTPAPAKTTPRPAPANKPATTSRPASTSDKVITSVERDLDIFRDWVHDKIDRADSGARRELPRIKEEYDQQSTRIDRAVDSLTVAGKREYEGLKNRYETWQARQQRLEKQAKEPETAQQTQTRMLGENVNVATARATEMTDLYGRFIDYVRANRRNWVSEDWAQASVVLTRLNERYEKVREQIGVEDRLRIRSWQGEFRTLEQARKTKDALE